MLKSPLTRFGNWLAFTPGGYAALTIVSGLISVAVVAGLAALFFTALN